MYQIKIEEYLLRDYVLEANGTKLSFRPRAIDQLIQGLALKIRSALHKSILVTEHPELDLIAIQGSDKRVGCEVSTDDPKLKLDSLDHQLFLDSIGKHSREQKDPMDQWVYDHPQLEKWIAVAHVDIKLIQRRVNFLMDLGWYPEGSLVTHGFNGQFIQVMRRDDEFRNY